MRRPRFSLKTLTFYQRFSAILVFVGFITIIDGLKPGARQFEVPCGIATLANAAWIGWFYGRRRSG
jgi:hypothetical protein